jgi:hypothetical protein
MEFQQPVRRLPARVLAASIFTAAALVASPVGAAYGHNTTTTIDEVIVLHDGSFYFKLHDEVCDTAGNRTIAYAYNGVAVNGSVPTEEGRDRMLRVGMAAQLSGATVQIFADDGGTRWGCLLGAVKLR